MKQRFITGQLARLEGMTDTFIVKIAGFKDGNYDVILMSGNGPWENTYKTDLSTLPDSYLSPLF